MTLKFLALQGAPYIYDISRLRVKVKSNGKQSRMILTEEGSFFPHRIECTRRESRLIRRPEYTAGEFYNYKVTESIIFMAIVDANSYFAYFQRRMPRTYFRWRCNQKY
jgi:hypothetical protein